MVYALREDGGLGRFHRKIHVLNPKQVKKFKEAYPDLPKNDWVDAFVIADHLRFGRINREVYMDDYRYKALQTLTRARFDVIQNLTREKQRFANYLFLKCSGMAQDKDIKNTSATTIALMERFETVDDLANADPEELTAFITEAGRGRFADPDATAKAVQAAARGSYRLPKTVNDTVNQAMAVSIASMRALKEQVKVLDKAIEQQFEIIPNTLTSIPGIGKVYSAGIIAEIVPLENQPVMSVRISLANVITTPPAKVRKPLARWLGSWLFRERPICTTPKPSRIIPMARIRPKMKSLRLLITVNGSLAAKAVVVQQHSMSTRAV